MNLPRKIALWQTACAFVLALTTMQSIAQTNPAPQPLPYSQDFSSLLWSSNIYPAGWQGWRLDAPSGTAFNLNPAASNVNMRPSSDASSVARRCHNYDGKIGQLNSANRDIAIVLSINTTGFSHVTVAYDVMTIRNPYDGVQRTRINEITLQYRVGSSGQFTNLSGIEYQNNTVNQIGAVTTPQNLQSRSIVLPSDCDNKSEVQLRWATREVSGSGGRPGFAVDNINICTAVANAGPDQSVCAGADVLLNGVLAGTSTGYWTTSGDGTFAPDSSALNATYSPGPNDITNGSVSLTLTSVGALPCDGSDNMTISFNSSTPAQPDPITGLPSDICPPVFGLVASTNNDPNATSYSWFVTAPNSGVTFSPPSTTNVQTIDIDVTPNSTYNIHVVAINACGTSLDRVFTIRRAVSTPLQVQGDVFACGGDVKVYDGSAVNGATSYTWDGPPGTLINGSSVPFNTTDTIVSVTFPAGFTTGSICQAANVACFTSSFKCITVNNAPPQPGLISGQKLVCAGESNVPYSIVAVPGATYTWTAPVNAVLTYGQGTNEVSVSYSLNFNAADISVVAQSACATSAIRKTTIVLTTGGSPVGRPLGVIGDAVNLCGASKTLFADPLVTDASYNWTFPAGTVVNYQYANRVDVTFPSNFNYSTLSVTGQLGCSISLPRTISIKGAPNPPVIAGPAGVCANSTGNIYSVPVLTPAVLYQWQAPSGVIIASGQGTESVSLDFGTSAGIVMVRESNACGNATGTLPVSIVCRQASSLYSSEASEKMQFNTWPNPANDYIYIEFAAGRKEMCDITITDLTGKTVMSSAFETTEGYNSKQINISHLAKGIYTMQVTASDGASKTKIVIQ